MGRTAKHLDSERGLDSAGTFFQISDVLLFGFADTAQRGAEADTDAILWLFAGILYPRVFECELCGYDCELRVAVEAFQSVRLKKLFRIPIANLAGTTHAENARVEASDAANAAPFGQDTVPKTIDAGADACDGADTSDDRASPSLPHSSLWRRRAHAVTLFVLASK